MGNVGGLEVLVVLLVALVVLGPEKLPEAVRKVGNVVGELRRVSKSFQDEMRSAAMLDEFGLEAKARDKGDAAVAASKAKQAGMEPTGKSLTENTEPFTNTDAELSSSDESDASAAAATDASSPAPSNGPPSNGTASDAGDDADDDDQPRIESDA